jgi:hypothetical protein
MTTDDFRCLALSLPGATESAHMGHPDFRINGKIFATLHYPDQHWGMVKLSPDEQHSFAQTHPGVFVPVNGAWGRQGATNVRLEAVETSDLEEALRSAWSNVGTASKARTARRLQREV